MLTRRMLIGAVSAAAMAVLPAAAQVDVIKIGVLAPVSGKAAFGNEPGTYGPALYEQVMIYADAL